MVEGWRVPNQHTAFFPLYPYFIKSLTFIFGGDFKLWGNVISLISVSLLSLLSFDFLKTYLNNEKVAFNSTILLISNPFSLHFYTLYTESLFLVLFIGCLICIQRNKWLLLIFLSIPLTLIRPNGIFTALIMGVFILEKNNTNLTWKQLLNPITWLKENHIYVLLPMAISFIAYLFYLRFATGDAFSFANAQNAWYKKTMFPLFALFSVGFWQNQFNSVYCVLVILFAIKSWKKLPISFNILV